MTYSRFLSMKARKSEFISTAWDVVKKIDSRYVRSSTKMKKINGHGFNFRGRRYTFEAFRTYGEWINVSILSGNGYYLIDAFEIG